MDEAIKPVDQAGWENREREEEESDKEKHETDVLHVSLEVSSGYPLLGLETSRNILDTPGEEGNSVRDEGQHQHNREMTQ